MARTPAAKKTTAADAAESPHYRFHYCNARPAPPRSFGPGVSDDRARAINTRKDKWVNGTEISYYFFDQTSDGESVTLADGSRQFVRWVGTEAQKSAVRKGFAAWADLGIGLRFKEVPKREQAMVRIGFMTGDGSWSYVGRAILDIAADQRTMNFGWNVANDLDTVIHEIGHTLGFEHEHQNPFSGIVWDEEKVYAALAAPPNEWSRQKTYYNIIRKLTENSVEGTTWDPDSVMHYPFEAGLIKQPAKYLTQPLQPAGGLSAHDVAQVKQIYPSLGPQNKYPELAVAQSYPLRIAAGEQVDLLIKPKRSRTYQVGTFGEADTVIVLYEQVNGELKYRGGDDDGGEDRNALLKLRMSRNSTYVLRVRLYYAAYAGETAVMWW
jgi:hypothetical protein